MHGQHWRVTVAVPQAARAALGTAKLKHNLGTDSLSQANLLKRKHVERFRRRIAEALETLGLPGKPDLRLAVELAKVAVDLRRNGTPAEWREFEEAVYERHAEIKWHGSRTTAVQDPELGPDEVDVPLPEQAQKAAMFSGVAYGSATPIDLLHDDYLKQLQVKERTRADDERAMRLILQWCKREGIRPILEEMDVKRAHAFGDAIVALTGTHHVTCKKYIGRLSVYWQWLIPRADPVKENVFAKVRVKGPKTTYDQKERAFTNAELATLLMGPATPHMHDLMMIAALTGARLDAIVDLKVRDTANRCLRFKPQKQEPAPRHVPIHPALAPVVERRVAGKGPNEDLFPEWPPVKAGSMRERSFKASNHFTEYRRSLKVSEVVEGKRRSLVNFHSFRRYFITAMERAGVQGNLISAIVGHQRSSITLDVYSEGPAMKAARRAIAKLRLPPLDGSPIREETGLMTRNASG
jgi:integrase